ncbi:helix-turn-helix transcriptional regulator [Streptomyces sp. NPDC015232]|uniref:helix-turn-helix transcriptional regulator n=1 Tax=unclassified Streptomyces TaxID=2593676 RepID=UPI0036FA853E
MSTTRPMLNQREAAAACGVSRSTIRRRREAGLLPGSVEDPDRGWLIPVEALLAAGFTLNAPAPPDAAAPSPTPDRSGWSEARSVAELQAELDRLRHQHALELAEARHGQALAESEVTHLRAQLADRAEHIGDLQRALQALMPAPVRPAIPQPSWPAPSSAPTGPVTERPGVGDFGQQSSYGPEYLGHGQPR